MEAAVESEPGMLWWAGPAADRSNKRKHGVAFTLLVSVFRDARIAADGCWWLCGVTTHIQIISQILSGRRRMLSLNTHRDSSAEHEPFSDSEIQKRADGDRDPIGQHQMFHVEPAD